MIKKRQQLTAHEKGVYWALVKRKKGYSTINEELWSLLVVVFTNHPHVIMSPNAKDTLQVKHADGEKVSVRKVLMQVGLRTIFSDTVHDIIFHSTIAPTSSPTKTPTFEPRSAKPSLGRQWDAPMLSAPPPNAKKKKLFLCHYDGGKKQFKTLCIAESSFSGHLKHGDSCGKCLYEQPVRAYP